MQIEMKNINKSFDGVSVLKNAYFFLRDCEICALMGENGAGKSTLMKILTGVYSKDSGEIFLDGKSFNFTHPKQAEKSGIAFIYQELNCLLDLTVEENIFLGKEIYGKLGILDKAAMRKKALEVISLLEVELNPSETLKNLSVGQRQMVEIARALLYEVKVIIMDEPTAALTNKETERLFEIIRSLKEKGVSVIYISHRMEEIFELCDRVTVMRDGEYIGTKYIKETHMNELINMMIGRDIGDRFPKAKFDIGEIVLETESLTKLGVFENISFKLRLSEVLGVYGLMGSKRTEIMKSIFGSINLDRGIIKIEGKEVDIRSPKDARKCGIGFITEDGKEEGLMMCESIKNNVSLNNFNLIAKNNVIMKERENMLSSVALADFSIKCIGVNQICSSLSGGNQQKVVFAKWILGNPKILILDEPTRGIDVGSKKEVYNIINDLTSNKVAMIMISSDLPEVLAMSDRIMVIHEGKISGFLDKEEATEEKVMILATGVRL